MHGAGYPEATPDVGTGPTPAGAPLKLAASLSIPSGSTSQCLMTFGSPAGSQAREREKHIVLWDLMVIRVRAAGWFPLGRA